MWFFYDQVFKFWYYTNSGLTTHYSHVLKGNIPGTAQTKGIGIALNTREHHELMMYALSPLFFTPSPVTLHATKNKSIHLGCPLTAAQKPSVLDTPPYAVPVISASKRSPEGSIWNKTSWIVLHKWQPNLCLFSRRTGTNFYSFFLLLLFCFLILLRSSRSSQERLRPTAVGSSFLPAFQNTTTHQKGAHTQFHPGLSFTILALATEHPFMSPLPQ